MSGDSNDIAVEDLQGLNNETMGSKGSHESLTSIKTSIDEETLMELAKKGIMAQTPV